MWVVADDIGYGAAVFKLVGYQLHGDAGAFHDGLAAEYHRVFDDPVLPKWYLSLFCGCHGMFLSHIGRNSMLASAMGPKLETVSSRGFALDVVVIAEYAKAMPN